MGGEDDGWSSCRAPQRHGWLRACRSHAIQVHGQGARAHLQPPLIRGARRRGVVRLHSIGAARGIRARARCRRCRRSGQSHLRVDVVTRDDVTFADVDLVTPRGRCCASWATLDLPTISYEIRTPTCARQVTGRCTDQRRTNHTGAEGIRRRASHIGAERLAMRGLRSTWRRGGLAEGWPCAACAAHGAGSAEGIRRRASHIGAEGWPCATCAAHGAEEGWRMAGHARLAQHMAPDRRRAIGGGQAI
jgi:hypothetical protein